MRLLALIDFVCLKACCSGGRGQPDPSLHLGHGTLHPYIHGGSVGVLQEAGGHCAADRRRRADCGGQHGHGPHRTRKSTISLLCNGVMRHSFHRAHFFRVSTQVPGTAESARSCVRAYFADLHETLCRQEEMALSVVDAHVRERLIWLRQQQEDMTILLSQVSTACLHCEKTLQQVRTIYACLE